MDVMSSCRQEPYVGYEVNLSHVASAESRKFWCAVKTNMQKTLLCYIEAPLVLL